MKIKIICKVLVVFILIFLSNTLILEENNIYNKQKNFSTQSQFYEKSSAILNTQNNLTEEIWVNINSNITYHSVITHLIDDNDNIHIIFDKYENNSQYLYYKFYNQNNCTWSNEVLIMNESKNDDIYIKLYIHNGLLFGYIYSYNLFTFESYAYLIVKLEFSWFSYKIQKNDSRIIYSIEQSIVNENEILILFMELNNMNNNYLVQLNFNINTRAFSNRTEYAIESLVNFILTAYIHDSFLFCQILFQNYIKFYRINNGTLFVEKVIYFNYVLSAIFKEDQFYLLDFNFPNSYSLHSYNVNSKEYNMINLSFTIYDVNNPQLYLLESKLYCSSNKTGNVSIWYISENGEIEKQLNMQNVCDIKFSNYSSFLIYETDKRENINHIIRNKKAPTLYQDTFEIEYGFNNSIIIKINDNISLIDNRSIKIYKENNFIENINWSIDNLITIKTRNWTGNFILIVELNDGFGNILNKTIYLNIYNVNPKIIQNHKSIFTKGEPIVLNWTIDDISLDYLNYTIYIDNDKVIANQTQVSKNILFDISNLNSGNYNVTILVWDNLGGFSMASNAIIIELNNLNFNNLYYILIGAISIIVIESTFFISKKIRKNIKREVEHINE